MSINVMLADLANLDRPLFWAILVGWIITVILHEYAHGLVAHHGGDYTVEERGGLTLNPLVYIDPLNTIILPLIFLIAGGVPLPGASTRIRLDLIRTRAWISGTFLAGPAVNFVMFFVCVLPLHPKFGWAPLWLDEWTPLQMFLATLGCLQMVSVVLNLLPVPGFDGFGAILPWLPREIQRKAFSPQARIYLLLGILVVFINYGNELFSYVLLPPLIFILKLMQFGDLEQYNLLKAFSIGLFGH